MVAFARRGGGSTLVAVVPRLVATLTADRDFALPDAEAWGDTRIGVGELGGRWRELFTGAEVRADGGGVRVAEVLGGFPVALLLKLD